MANKATEHTINTVSDSEQMPVAVMEPRFTFRGISTRYATHAMHPYVAAMVPSLAKEMIKITKPIKLLDPFCGGGVFASKESLQESKRMVWMSTSFPE